LSIVSSLKIHIEDRFQRNQIRNQQESCNVYIPWARLLRFLRYHELQQVALFISRILELL